MKQGRMKRLKGLMKRRMRIACNDERFLMSCRQARSMGKPMGQNTHRKPRALLK